MDEDELRDRIANLEKQVAELQQRTVGDIRLGPSPETPKEIAARANRMENLIERIKTENDPARLAAVVAATPLPHEHEVDPAGRQICTTSGEAPSKVRTEQIESEGQHKSYVVLCEEERKKGFVRPYRDSYTHVGERPKYSTADLTPEQHAQYDQYGYVIFEIYPEGSPESNGGTSIGRYWTKEQLTSGCGIITTMGRSLSETYARDPKFYGATFCCQCNKHLPVAEFVWTVDGQRVGS